VKTDVVAARVTRGERSLLTAIDRAVELLRAGGVVALPTETVYGLAANALSPDAVVRIFEAKERPNFDPLIVHLPDISWLERVTDIYTSDKEIVAALAKRFWPGPFTMVLPKTELVQDIVTAGLDTVAIRISAHPLFQEVIRAFGKPLAAPSANRFGRISPTTAEHVMDELGSRIPLILDAGPTTHGIESTVVAIRNGAVEILRPGPITEEELRRGIGSAPISPRPVADTAAPLRSPGQLPSHYAPKTPLRLIDDTKSFVKQAGRRIGVLAWHPVPKTGFEAVRVLSEKQDLREAAANLFRYLRELDAMDLDLIMAERVPDQGLGLAINDRLGRAARS
jgi:L-threonylcarbamoyladenylate synthase